MRLEIYIHIPFCIRKCSYCDFLSFPSDEEMRENYCRALMEEIRRTGEITSDSGENIKRALSVGSIYLGGGTPSVLTGRQTAGILDSIRSAFPVKADAEISTEANPGTLDEERLYTYRQAGINRLSIGLQSTRDDLLYSLGRIHTFKEFEDSYHLARKAGFDNINIDIMSALPGQTLNDYKETLRIITGLGPEHISSYSLIIEEGTPLASDSRLLKKLPDEETDRKMYDLTKDVLGQHGYGRYEISNYARPGKECRHNIGYWDGTAYLGLGLGASSYYDHARFSNETDMARYLKDPFIPFCHRTDYEMQTKKQEMEDRMIFGLRMMSGVSRKKFKEDFGVEIDDIYGKQIRRFKQLGLLETCGDKIRLTGRGIDVSNRVFEEMLLEELKGVI